MKKAYALIAAIVLLAFYYFFLRDYMAYRSVKRAMTEEACQEYFSDFPDGIYYENVRFLEVDITRDIYKLRSFVEDYPSSKFSGDILQIKDALWDDEIERYEARVSSVRTDEEAVSFFRALLAEMKAQNAEGIPIAFKSSVNLKDYEDYPRSIRSILGSGVSPAIEGNIRSLTENFSQGDIQALESIVEHSIGSSLDSVFSPGFMELSSGESANWGITISYSIGNQEIEEASGFPEIWTYTVDGDFGAYLLGISIKFDFRFDLPNSAQTYEFSEVGDPSGTISNINGIEDGYREMTKMSFGIFADNISSNFGL